MSTTLLANDFFDLSNDLLVLIKDEYQRACKKRKRRKRLQKLLKSVKKINPINMVKRYKKSILY